MSTGWTGKRLHHWRHFRSRISSFGVAGLGRNRVNREHSVCAPGMPSGEGIAARKGEELDLGVGILCDITAALSHPRFLAKPIDDEDGC
jgi:hypothetical protein